MQIRRVTLPWLLLLSVSLPAGGEDRVPNRRGVLLDLRIVRVPTRAFDDPEKPSRLLSDIEAFFVIQASKPDKEDVKAAFRKVFSDGKRIKISGRIEGTCDSIAFLVQPVIAADGSTCVISVEPVKNTISVPKAVKVSVKRGQSLLVFLRTDDANETVDCILFSPRIVPLQAR